MVRLNSANFLSLAEVEVYGTLSGNQNEGQNENENDIQIISGNSPMLEMISTPLLIWVQIGI